VEKAVTKLQNVWFDPFAMYNAKFIKNKNGDNVCEFILCEFILCEFILHWTVIIMMTSPNN